MVIAVSSKAVSGGLYLMIVGNWSIALEYLSELIFILSIVMF